jgi:hypothetical protein
MGHRSVVVESSKNHVFDLSGGLESYCETHRELTTINPAIHPSQRLHQQHPEVPSRLLYPPWNILGLHIDPRPYLCHPCVAHDR